MVDDVPGISISQDILAALCSGECPLCVLQF
jgi:hypothetical protein